MGGGREGKEGILVRRQEEEGGRGGKGGRWEVESRRKRGGERVVEGERKKAYQEVRGEVRRKRAKGRVDQEWVSVREGKDS